MGFGVDSGIGLERIKLKGKQNLKGSEEIRNDVLNFISGQFRVFRAYLTHFESKWGQITYQIEALEKIYNFRVLSFSKFGRFQGQNGRTRKRTRSARRALAGSIFRFRAERITRRVISRLGSGARRAWEGVRRAPRLQHFKT